MALSRSTPTIPSLLKTPWLPFLLAFAVVGSGCLWRTQRIEPPQLAARTATLEELLTQLERFESLKSMRATVDIGLSYLNDDMNRLTNLKDVRGFILAERPAKARIQAQYPVTHQKAFDMVSDADEFSVYLVWNKRFIQGPTSLETHSEKRIENIRPHHIVEPLLIAPPRSDETAALDNQIRSGTLYHVVVFRKQVGDHEVITRKLWFDRTTLELHQLEIYDGQGNIVTVATYSQWLEENGAPYPTSVNISRPLDGYRVAITIRDPGINEPLPEDAFTLEPPAGVEIERVGDSEQLDVQASAQ